MPKHAFKITLYLLLTASTLTACATTVPGQSYRLSDNGYATVLSAPPSKPLKQDIEELKDRIETSSSFKIPKEYAQFTDEVNQLKATLIEKEPDNFTEFRYVWEPEFKHLFSFKRDPQKTLAKYTSNPYFKSGKQRHSQPYLQAKLDEFSKVAGPSQILNGSQVNMMTGYVEISPGYYEDEFFLIPGMQRFRNDPDIEFTFLKRRPPEQIIDPRVAPHIRLFQRDNNEHQMVVMGSTKATLQLSDGCFFAKENNSLILFSEGSNLGLDEDGYIIIYDERGNVSRVGEKMEFYSGFRPVEDVKYTKPLQDACGQHPVVKIHAPRSEYIKKQLDKLY